MANIPVIGEKGGAGKLLVSRLLGQCWLRGDDFEILKTSGLLDRAQTLNAIAIKRLRESSMTKIDAGSNSFWTAAQPEDKGGTKLSILEPVRSVVFEKRVRNPFSREPLSCD